MHDTSPADEQADALVDAVDTALYRPAHIAILEAAIAASARERLAHARRAGGVRTAAQLDGIVLGQRAALWALASLRYAVVREVVGGAAVLDTWTDDVVEGGLDQAAADGLARDGNRQNAGDLDDALGVELAREGVGGHWPPLPLTITT